LEVRGGYPNADGESRLRGSTVRWGLFLFIARRFIVCRRKLGGTFYVEDTEI
jgi:hypothetical protein